MILKFQYAYRDCNNERHDDIVVASSKDEAYKFLRSRGVKPIFVAPAPGLLNRFAGIGVKGFAIVALVVLVLILGMLSFSRGYGRAQLTVNDEFENAMNARMRRQLIGDVAIIEKGLRTGWADVFESEGERFLASFAVPGEPAAQRSTCESNIVAALSVRCEPNAKDGIEARQIKSMVEGLKDELRRYLAAGGSVAGYGRRLVVRQEEEIRCYQQARQQVENAVRRNVPIREVDAMLDRYNASLRGMGIRPIVMPKKKEFLGE